MNKTLFIVLIITNISIASDKLLSHRYIKKNILPTIEDRKTTCLDEVIKRKKQINISSLTGGLMPVEVTAATGIAGAGIGALVSLPSGFTLADGILAGGAFGVYAGYAVLPATITYAGATVAVNAFKSKNNKILANLIVEARNGIAGAGVKAFKNNQISDVADEDILKEIAHLDEVGSLCDGSLVGSRIFGKGEKLKHKIPRISELRAHFK